jgi:thymidylate kinase
VLAINPQDQIAMPGAKNGTPAQGPSPLYGEESAANSPIGLVRELCQALDTEDILYCRWKSTATIDSSATGESDLDLLIRRADAQRFGALLHRLGFKIIVVPAERQLPGVLDYFGYDKGADRIVHVHAHYQLILGHDMTKNYRLPIEQPYLESSRQGELFRAPAPEFEFIVFVIRMVLKHSTWDAKLGRHESLTDTEQLEQSLLQSQINHARIHEILKQSLPYLDVALFDACVGTLQPDCPSGTRIRAAQRLQNSLQAHARRHQALDLYLRLWRRGVRAVRRRLPVGLLKQRPASGGAIIALVGGDGAGKSTAVDELHKWLSQYFDTKKVHLGKPPWSWTTFALRGTLKVARFLTKPFGSESANHHKANTVSSALPGYAQILRQVCTARDRHHAYVKGRRFATNGGIVICDRFPVSEIRLMDGPLVEKMVDTSRMNRFTRLLAHLEKRFYASILPPDLLVVLRVDPEIAVQRCTDENADFVRVRSREIWDLDWRQTRAHVVDAGQSKAEVLSELKTLVWSSI